MQDESIYYSYALDRNFFLIIMIHTVTIKP